MVGSPRKPPRSREQVDEITALRAALKEAVGAFDELQRYGRPRHPEEACWCEMTKLGVGHSPGCKAARAARDKAKRLIE